MKAQIYSDGAARGNPGLAGAGAAIIKDGKVVKNIKKFLGEKTNNEAEYIALLEGIKEAKKLGISDLEAFVDSELLTRQINGIYKVKAGNLKLLYFEIQKEKIELNSFKISHVRREKNKIADKLANEAIDEYLAKKNRF